MKVREEEREDVKETEKEGSCSIRWGMQPPPPPAAAALEVFKGSLQQQIPGVFSGVYMYIHVNLRCSRSNIKPCNRPFGGASLYAL